MPCQEPLPVRRGGGVACAFDLGKCGQKLRGDGGGGVLAEFWPVFPPRFRRCLGQHAAHWKQQLGRFVERVVDPVGCGPQHYGNDRTGDEAHNERRGPQRPKTLAGAGSGSGARGSHGTRLSRLRVTGAWTRRRPYALRVPDQYFDGYGDRTDHHLDGVHAAKR